MDEQQVAEDRLKAVVEFLYLTTKKEVLDEEEIIKECEKKDLKEDEIKELLSSLLEENILARPEPHSYSKGIDFAKLNINEEKHRIEKDLI